MKRNASPLPPPHIGKLLGKILRTRNVSRAVMARTMGVSTSVPVRYAQSPSMLTSTLWDISQVLGYNFFADIAALLPPDFDSGVTVDTTLEARVAELERELAAVTRERDLLLKMMAPDQRP